MNLLTSIKSMKNMIVVKILAIFLICSGCSAILFFTANYFIVRYSIEKIVITDLNTTVNLIFDTMDLHFSRTEGQWYKFKDYLSTGVIDPDVEARYNDLKFRLSKIQILNHGYVFIINTKGEAIVHPEEEGKNLGEYAFVKEIIKKKNGVIEYEWKGKNKLVAYKYYAPFEWI